MEAETKSTFFFPDTFVYNCTGTEFQCISLSIIVSHHHREKQMPVGTILVVRLTSMGCLYGTVQCYANILKATLVPDTTELP